MQFPLLPSVPIQKLATTQKSLIQRPRRLDPTLPPSRLSFQNRPQQILRLRRRPALPRRRSNLPRDSPSRQTSRHSSR
jgi:hypothetical protein